MLTFTGNRNLFTGTGTYAGAGLTNNASTTNLVFADTFINQYTLELLHKFPLIISEQSYKFNGFQTLPNTQFVTLPVPMRKVSTVVITVGNSTTYPGVGFNWFVRECPNLQYWNQLNLTNNIMSDIPQYFMIINGQLGLYPRPAVGYNPITLIGQQEPVALGTADITTATITAPYALTLASVPLQVVLNSIPKIGDTGGTLTTNFTLTTGSYSVSFSSGETQTATITNGSPTITWGGALTLANTSTTLSGVLSAPFSATFSTGVYQILFSSGEQRLCTLTSGSTGIVWNKPLTVAATTAVKIRTSTGGEILTIGTVTPTTAWIGYVLQTTDGYWYHVDGYIDTTHVSISQPYQGAAISTAASIVGQSSLVPQAYQMIPLYRAAHRYYSTISKDKERADINDKDANDLEAVLRNDYGNKSTDPTIEDNIDKQLINPNLSVNITGSSTNQ